MGALAFRRMTAGDRDRVLEMLRAFEDDYLPRVLDSWLHQEPGGCYLAEEEGRVIAFASIHFPLPGEAWLRGMRVHPSAQGRGAGTAFSRFQVEEARRLGAHVVRLGTSYKNRAVHRMIGEKLRFELIARWCFSPGPPPDGRRAQGVRAATRQDSDALEEFLRELERRGALFPYRSVGSPWQMASFRPEHAGRCLEEGEVLLRESPQGITGMAIAIPYQREGKNYLGLTYLAGDEESLDQILAHLPALARRRGLAGLSYSLPEPQYRRVARGPAEWVMLVYEMKV